MQLESPAQQATFEKVRGWLQQILGEDVQAAGDRPLFGVRYGSAWVEVAVLPLGEKESAVRVYSVVVRGAELDPTLLHWLLAQGCLLPFGAFALDPDGDVVLLQTLVGSGCTRELLQTTLQVIANVADQVDDAIVARWGGEKAFEDDDADPRDQT